jgi:uncharacterized protein YebE (UPF0316 family)
LANLDHRHLALVHASSFAVGNYVGITIESHVAIGNDPIRCISFNRDVLAANLRDAGFKVVSFDGDRGEGYPVELLLIIEKKRNAPRLIQLIKDLDPDRGLFGIGLQKCL